MFPLQSHVISLVTEFQVISVNKMARWIVFRYFTLSLHFTTGLQSAVCILPLVYILPPVCSLQSAVCSPQSAFYTDRFENLVHKPTQPVALKRRPRRLQTVQTVQTEYFFSYTSSRNCFRLTFFGSSYKILPDMFVIYNIRPGCPGTRRGMSWHQKTKMADDCYEALYSPSLVMHCVRMKFRLL